MFTACSYSLKMRPEQRNSRSQSVVKTQLHNISLQKRLQTTRRNQLWEQYVSARLHPKTHSKVDFSHLRLLYTYVCYGRNELNVLTCVITVKEETWKRREKTNISLIYLKHSLWGFFSPVLVSNSFLIKTLQNACRSLHFIHVLQIYFKMTKWKRVIAALLKIKLFHLQIQFCVGSSYSFASSWRSLYELLTHGFGQII